MLLVHRMFLVHPSLREGLHRHRHRLRGRARQRHHTPGRDPRTGQRQQQTRRAALQPVAEQREPDHRGGDRIGQRDHRERRAEAALVGGLRQQQPARREGRDQQRHHDHLPAEQRTRAVRDGDRDGLCERRGDARGEAGRGRVPQPGARARPGQYADQGRGRARDGQRLRDAQHIVGRGPGRRDEHRGEPGQRQRSTAPLDGGDPPPRHPRAQRHRGDQGERAERLDQREGPVLEGGHVHQRGRRVEAHRPPPGTAAQQTQYPGVGGARGEPLLRHGGGRVRDGREQRQDDGGEGGAHRPAPTSSGASVTSGVAGLSSASDTGPSASALSRSGSVGVAVRRGGRITTRATPRSAAAMIASSQ